MAFKTNIISPSYIDVLNCTVTYACGPPLVLEAIALHLFGKSIEEWKFIINTKGSLISRSKRYLKYELFLQVRYLKWLIFNLAISFFYSQESSTIASTRKENRAQLGDKITSGEQISVSSRPHVSENIGLKRSKQTSIIQAEPNAEVTGQLNENQA